MASPISGAGMGSSLDVSGLVSQLMEVERQPLTKLNQKEAATQVKISAYASFRGTLSSFQASLQSLNDASNYAIPKASIDDATIGTVSANATAVAGAYSLEVTDLAKSQKLASGVFSSMTESIGTGTLTIQYGTTDAAADPPTFTLNGDRPTQTVNIDTAHMSLSGVRDAINAAKIGVTANIVNDGKGYRLVMSSKDTGAANSLKISVEDADGNNTNQAGLSRLAYDPTAAADAGKNMSQIMAAQDARMFVDGLEVTKSSNTVSDVIAGVTLNLSKTNAGAATRLAVNVESTVATTNIDNFVKAYNELNKTITDLTKYNAATKQAGALQGDAAIRGIASDIRNGLTSLVSGSIGSYNALPQIGLTFDRNGTMKLDTAKLQEALRNDPTAVQSLFASAAKVDDPLVKFAGGTTASKAGNYALSIGSLATQGAVTGSVAAELAITSSNDTLNLSVNGTATTVKLAAGTYTEATLAAELQSKLNGASALQTAGAKVTVTQEGGVLSITSQRWGSASKVEVTGGNGVSALFGTNTPTSVAGADVTGSIGGFLANGSGQRLTGTGPTDGLKLDVTGGVPGARGNLEYGVGIAGKLDQMISKLLANKGLIASKTEGLQGQVTQIQNDRERLETRLETTEARYRKQFNALDQQMSSMQSMSAYLAQQLAGISRG